mgnify:CR=1 FL=1
MEKLAFIIGRQGYASVRHFLYFDHFHILALFCTSTGLLQPLDFDSRTSTSLDRHFVKSGLLIGREVQVEVKFRFSQWVEVPKRSTVSQKCFSTGHF